MAKDTRRDNEKIWAAMGFAAGTYSPGTISNSSSLAGTYVSGVYAAPASNKPAQGTSYSFGFSFGAQITGRWVLQAGVNYLNQSSAYTSNYTTLAAGANRPYAMDLFNLSSKSSSAISTTNPYQVNSILEYVSIPVQAGYRVINRKAGLQMNAGFATDVFIRNSIIDQSGQTNNYSQGAGADSPYRQVNWAGLVSTELSYKLGRQYRISLVPGVRYLFNSSLKSGATTHSYLADIGFRFRYILR